MSFNQMKEISESNPWTTIWTQSIRHITEVILFSYRFSGCLIFFSWVGSSHQSRDRRESSRDFREETSGMLRISRALAEHQTNHSFNSFTNALQLSIPLGMCGFLRSTPKQLNDSFYFLVSLVGSLWISKRSQYSILPSSTNWKPKVLNLHQNRNMFL